MNIPERLDAYRVFPRITLLAFVISVGMSLNWYMSYEVKYVTSCDDRVLEVVLKNKGKLEDAERLACRVTDVVGHPSGYTFLLSTLLGASAAVFGLYANSGRKWDTND